MDHACLRLNNPVQVCEEDIAHWVMENAQATFADDGDGWSNEFNPGPVHVPEPVGEPSYDNPELNSNHHSKAGVCIRTGTPTGGSPCSGENWLTRSDNRPEKVALHKADRPMALARSGDEGAPFAFLVVENNSHNHKEDYIKGIFHSHLRMWQVCELADGQEREDIVENLTLACIWLPMDESALSKWLEVQPGTKKAQTDPTDWANYHSLASVFHFTRVEGEQRPEL
ncbi:hypothetical protein PQX77_003974, partial [Marasmius sp. AFHP31]